jgi:clan AA aspartic protease
MMRGSVNARREATLPLRVRGLTGAVSAIDFVIDTGFDSSAVIPERIAINLGLVSLGADAATLADGSVRIYELYLGQLLWHGIFQDCMFFCAGDEALIGMGLLNGNELRIEVTPGGMVEVKPLP